MLVFWSSAWFRGRLVFKAHRLLYHSSLGSKVIKKQKRTLRAALRWRRAWRSWVPRKGICGSMFSFDDTKLVGMLSRGGKVVRRIAAACGVVECS